MCSILKSSLFSSCNSVVDPTLYMEMCKYEMCSDSSSVHQNLHRCSIVAAYAHDCALAGVNINWIEDADISSSCYASNYGTCPGGSQYLECTKTCNATCQQLSSRDHGKCSTYCVPGM